MEEEEAVHPRIFEKIAVLTATENSQVTHWACASTS